MTYTHSHTWITQQHQNHHRQQRKKKSVNRAHICIKIYIYRIYMFERFSLALCLMRKNCASHVIGWQNISKLKQTKICINSPENNKYNCSAWNTVFISLAGCCVSMFRSFFYRCLFFYSLRFCNVIQNIIRVPFVSWQ